MDRPKLVAVHAPPGGVKEVQLKTYRKQLKDNVKSMLDNFTSIVKSAQIEDEGSQVLDSTQCAQDAYEMSVRAANIVRSGESLLNLVSNLKEYLVLNDFPSLNESISRRRLQLQQMQSKTERSLRQLRDDVSAQLYEMETAYYSSQYRRGYDADDEGSDVRHKQGEEAIAMQ